MVNIDEILAAAFIAQDSILESEPPSTNPSHERIPSVVVLEIFQYLDLHSLLKCRLVCSHFQYLIDSTTSLQYKIELAVAGQQDGSYGDMSARREMLKIHQKRWDGLQWTEVIHLPMLSTDWEVYGGVFAQASSNPYTLHLQRIPSQSRGIKEKNWILDLSTPSEGEVGMGIFGMDPGQDLLVITTTIGFNESLRIHLLTLSKGERHPLTSEPCIVIHGPEYNATSVVICHDFLSVLVGAGAMLWNWKTGQVLMHIVNHHYRITSMVFLNERYILMAIREDTPYLIAVDFLAESPEPRQIASLKNYFIFRFPAISRPLPAPVVDMNIIVRANPPSTWGPDTDLPVPFSMIPQNRLLVIDLIFGNINEYFHFAILEASFLSLIKIGLRVNNNSFDWSMWGPEHSRAFLNDWPSWLLPSHGTRLAMKRYLPHRKVVVDVYDFNQLGCRNKKQDMETPENMDVAESNEIIENRTVHVSAPTRIQAKIFHDQVDTRLGYSVTSWSVPGNATGFDFIDVMCSEDAVIIVDETNRIFEIYTV